VSQFGELLKSLRKKHKITQRQLAERVGIDFTYISKIESGNMDPPAEDKIVKMAVVFGEDPDQLLIAAKKVPRDFQKIITEHKEVPVFLRKVPHITPEQWKKIHGIIEQKNQGRNDE